MSWSFCKWCSAPIIHLSGVTWYPPAYACHERIMTLTLDKLFTVWGDFSETCQLRQTCSGVMNVPYVIVSTFHACSSFSVVTDGCHANPIFVTHVTINCKWCQSFCAIWINDISSIYTGLLSDSWTRLKTAFQSLSKVTMVTLARIRANFNCTGSRVTTTVDVSFTLIQIFKEDIRDVRKKRSR